MINYKNIIKLGAILETMNHDHFKFFLQFILFDYFHGSAQGFPQSMLSELKRLLHELTRLIIAYGFWAESSQNFYTTLSTCICMRKCNKS